MFKNNNEMASTVHNYVLIVTSTLINLQVGLVNNKHESS